MWDFGRKERRMQVRKPPAASAGWSRRKQHEVRITLGYKPALWALLRKPETWWGITWNAENKPVVLLALVNGFMFGYISFYNLQLKIEISAWTNSLTLVFLFCFCKPLKGVTMNSEGTSNESFIIKIQFRSAETGSWRSDHGCATPFKANQILFKTWRL